ncbi:MAG: Ig-like domain-containing protein [Acidobacteria bacterium]|nr:Ig-like domain-containing protein [Acidobacteriota bacterium]
MRNRSLGALLLLGSVVPFTSCAVDPALTSIVLTPSGYSVLLGPCGTQQVVANFTATGNYTRPNHATVTRDITNSATWYSYDTQLITMAPGGIMSVVTCADPNNTSFQASTLISASQQGFHGVIRATATVNLVEPKPTTTASHIVSLSIVRLSNSIGSAQYVAVGKAAEGMLVPLNGKVVWSSSNPQAVRVDASTGIARAMTAGKSTLTATYTGKDGSSAIGTVDFGSLAQN